MQQLTPLPGHTTPETAYLVEDYPYGFTLRCKIRYWLEYHKRHGFRLCSQTTNPKLSGEVWNKPKCSTYAPLAVMGLDDQNHVQWVGCRIYDESAAIHEFLGTYGNSFDDNQQAVAVAMLKVRAAYDARKAAQTPATDTAVIA